MDVSLNLASFLARQRTAFGISLIYLSYHFPFAASITSNIVNLPDTEPQGSSNGTHVVRTNSFYKRWIHGFKVSKTLKDLRQCRNEMKAQNAHPCLTASFEQRIHYLSQRARL